ncbi:MAG: hypothetical protein IPP74_06875 [Alphaproteobacteria bacterium]|nr:hypothetical protein [Alphaproteobacteria bacterium]
MKNNHFYTVILLTYLLFPINSFGLEKPPILKLEKKEYIYPLKIKISYWGYMGTEYKDNPQTLKRYQEIESFINNEKDYIEKYYNNSSREDILKNEPNLTKTFLNYLMEPSTGKESYAKNPPEIPISCGYVIIDKSRFILPFPKKGVCEWLVYELTSTINTRKFVTLLIPSGLRKHRYDNKKDKQQDKINQGHNSWHYGPETFQIQDPYFSQALISKLEWEGFRIENVEENIDLNFAEPADAP